MATPLQPFESSWQKKLERKQKREAREQYLEKAKADYEKRQRKRDREKQRGEDTWMLPSVNERIDTDMKKAKKSKKKKKEKKKSSKKEKKKKKRKHKSDSDSSDSSSSDSEEPQWVEKTIPAPSAGPKLERQDWMIDPIADIFAGTTREDIRAKKKKEAGEDEEKPVVTELGQHELELNPYWKDGGTGLPEEKPSKDKRSRTQAGAAGDGGVNWLRKARVRCEETAKEEGRSLEEVAAERYGSLKKLDKMISDAEKLTRHRDDPSHERRRERDRDREREYGSWSGSSGLSRLAGRFMRPGEENLSGSQPERRAFVKEGDLNESPQRKKLNFMRPGDSESQFSQSRSNRDPHAQDTPRWKKTQPSASSYDRGKEMDRRSRRSRRSRSRSRDRERKRSRSRSLSHSQERYHTRRDEREEGDRQQPSRWRKQTREEETRARSPDRRKRSSYSPSSDSRNRKVDSQNSSSSSSSSSSESESDKQDSSASESEPEPEPQRILTEGEMNAIGAKILKAELMGNEELVARLKAELEAARKAKAAAGPEAALASRQARPSTNKDDTTVILTRTDRAGNVRPLPAAHHKGEEGQRRRKKQKVSTHSKGGERERYFADDDRYKLRDLVEREKLSTAEDANHMFARLAGRSIEKTDDEYQIDDVMVGRANKKMSEAVNEQRERSAAILQHRKMAAALEKCRYCFENIPKHLIIAIGIKVYLCLPNHRSMVPGHCLIVPMQHDASSTAVEDDVWAEVQVFRKGLTAMFRDQEEDAIFMETSMFLNRHPHMVVECVPVPRETGDMAPIYFKKAIQESDTEWAQNKKLIDLSKKDIRHSVPKGFPFFSVDFGLEGGFAHVIEDEQNFPSYFGREIVGGMLDIEPTLWRKPHKEEFDIQRQKVLKFAEWWKPYDWTQKLKSQASDSD